MQYKKYDLVIRVTHWLMFLLIGGMVIAGELMTDMPASDEKWQLYSLHKSTGVILFLLIIFRIFWRLTHKQKAAEGGNTIIEKIARLNIIALYIVMFMFPFSGLMGSLLGGHSVNFFGLFTIPPAMKDKLLSGIFHEIHEITAVIFYVIIFLHVMGTFFHHFIKKDAILKKIT